MSKFIYFVDVNNPAYKNQQKLSAEDVAEDLVYTYKSRNMNFDKDLNLKGKYCFHPFNTITIDGFGDVYACICQAWLPISLGKIWEFDSLDDIVKSPRAREIQSSILDGSYRYCDNNTCGILQTGGLKEKITHRPETVNWINFAMDASCNLTCPSCRTEFKFLSEGPDFDRRIMMTDHIAKLIENHDRYIKFTLSGDGDPFASSIYRHLLSKLNLTNNKFVEIEIVTNGILAKAHWHKMQGIYNNIIRFKISFDAGSESIYNITRRGGDWNKLLENSKYIINWKRKTFSRMAVAANFVVQTTNYREMSTFVELCDALGFDEIIFQKVTDWGTFTNFKDHAVWQSDHPEHDNFLKELQHPSLNNRKVNFTNLTTIRNEIK